MRAAIAILFLAACSAPTVPIGSEQLSISAADLDLVSPVRCQLKNETLRKCIIPTVSLAPTVVDSAVPLKTVVTVNRAGTCSTQYPVQVQLTGPGIGNADLRYMSQSSIELRASDGAPLTSLAIADSSPWTPSLVVDKTCRVSIHIDFNLVDVDSKERAESILYGIRQRLDAAVDLRDRYRELVLFSSAYTFMRQVAQNFHTELTNDMMQQLRAAAIANASQLETLITECGPEGGVDRSSLLDLYLALGALGDPSAWQNSDGSTMSLEEFLGPEAQNVLATINEIVANGNAAGAPNYDQLYQGQANVVLEITALQALAVQQLAPWLD